MLSFDQALKPTIGNNLKKFFDDVDDRTPTRMETKFLQQR